MFRFLRVISSFLRSRTHDYRLSYLENNLALLRSGNVCVGGQLYRTSAFLWKEELVKVPPFPESISDGDVKWSKAVGDEVEQDEVVCEIETDKTAIPVLAPGAGVIKEQMATEGSSVRAGQVIFKMELGPVKGKAKAAEKAPRPETKPAAKPAGRPSGKQPRKEREPSPAREAPVQTLAPCSEAQRTTRSVKMSRLRLRLSERLKEAQNSAAMLTTFNEIDMSNLISLRNKFQSIFVKRHGTKLGFMSPFIKAASYALLDQPVVNAMIVEKEVMYRDYIDISVAVASPKGLMVPVIRDVQRMNYGDIEKALAVLAVKARDGKVTADEMEGGTFTISNGGVFGSLISTPIINPPQSAILGMHITKPRPIAVDNKVVIRPMMYVALTYDHRLIDGREAVTFLGKIKNVIEDVEIMLLNL